MYQTTKKKKKKKEKGKVSATYKTNIKTTQETRVGAQAFTF